MSDYEILKVALLVEVLKVVSDPVVAAEVAANVSEFDEWIWGEDDGRKDRGIGVSGVAEEGPLKDAVKAVVEENLEALREIDASPVGVEVEALVSQLLGYVKGSEAWGEEYRKEQENLFMLDQMGGGEEVYLHSGYGGKLEELVGVEPDP